MKGDCPADPGSGYYTRDSPAQFAEILAAQNGAVEVWSAHYYDNTSAAPSPSCWFPDCVCDASVLELAASTAAKHGAVLYVGEYGHLSTPATRETWTRLWSGGPLPSRRMWRWATLPAVQRRRLLVMP